MLILDAFSSAGTPQGKGRESFAHIPAGGRDLHPCYPSIGTAVLFEGDEAKVTPPADGRNRFRYLLKVTKQIGEAQRIRGTFCGTDLGAKNYTPTTPSKSTKQKGKEVSLPYT